MQTKSEIPKSVLTRPRTVKKNHLYAKKYFKVFDFGVTKLESQFLFIESQKIDMSNSLMFYSIVFHDKQ